MRYVQGELCAAAVWCAAASANAQLGTIDQRSQQSPTDNKAAWFTLGTNLVWQQQVRAGLTGDLSSIQFTSGGPAGGVITLRIRPGAAWSNGPVQAQRTIRKNLTGPEMHTLDFSEEIPAHSLLMPMGATFVIEFTGTGSNLGLYGSYVNPSTGPALYPHPLYFQGSRFLNGGWRIGFTTYVISRPLCLSDFNSDGGVDGDDITAFISAWEYGDPEADVSEDGGVDGNDLYEFFVLWEGASC
ncbi:MAG: hypothetical protein JNK25_01435 [Phycisphaerae bacterium]|nr:hypothetical protein [Phycisphaerae bacterium]